MTSPQSSQQKIDEWLSKSPQQLSQLPQPPQPPQPIISEQRHYKSKSYEVLIEPSATDAEKLVREGLLRKDCIVLVGSCVVNYFGRASSILPRGERIVILKPDGTVLVHQKEKREPVNWNPPGCRASARAIDGMLQITSVRTRPREVLVISFDSLKMVSRFSLHDDEELYLFGTESQMVEEIVKNPNLIEEGFRPITKELRTEYGMIDLYGVDRRGNVVVIEFKRGRAGLDAVSQLKRYVDELKKERGGRVRGVLAAPSITESALKLLKELGLEYIRIERRLPKLGEA
jgi:RecB family endonuclease NucS